MSSPSGFDHPAVSGLDRALERRAARLRGNRAADRVFYGLSQAANHSLLWHGINLIDAVLGGPRRRRAAVRRSALLVVEQVVVNGPLKSAVGRVRPDHVEDHPHDLRTPTTSSFPSGHASAAACATHLLTRDLGHRWAWRTLGVAVAWSRVHVGAHHPSDVVGGAVIGAALARVVERAVPPVGRDRPGDPPGR